MTGKRDRHAASLLAVTFWAGLLASALLLFSIPARPQAVAPQKPLRHEVAVTLKLIQVYVTDKAGKPILDLTSDDFILADDGKAQILTEFEKHVLTLPAPEAPPAEKVAVTPLPSDAKLLNRKVILFFDFGHSTPQGVLKAREAALHFLDTSLMPTDQVALVSYGLISRLKVHEWLTAERPRIRRLVEGIGLRDSLGYVEDADEAYQRSIDAGGFQDVRTSDAGIVGGKASPAQSTQSDARFQARNFISRLTALAQALRYEPGRKVIVLFSSGVPGSLFYNIDPSVLIGSRRDMNADLRGAYEDLCGLLATSNAVVYPMDTDPASAGSDTQTGRATLMRMAAVTGGRFMGDVSNYEEHFHQIQTLTAYYYVLGYSIDERWDGRYHKIKVSVRRPGCEVQAQAGYFNPKPFSDYSALEKRIHLVDLALSGKPIGQAPLRFPVTVLPLSPGRENNLYLAAEIPVAKVRERVGNKAEVYGLVFDDRDEVVAEQRSEEDFATVPDESAFILFRASVPPGLYRGRFVIRSLETGAAAVAGATAIVPLPKDTEIRIYPPLFLKADRGGRYLEAFLPKAPAVTEILLFDPLQYAPRLESTLRKNGEVWAAVRCSFAGPPIKEIRLTAFLYDKQTRAQIPVPLTVLAAKDGPGLKTFFVGIKIPEVEADEYRFSFLAEDPGSGRSAMEVVDVIVE